MKIAVGSDHIAVDLKNMIVDYLKSKKIEVIDVGTYNKERTHYPIYASKACDYVLNGEAKYAILICGTGVGMSMAANKIAGIRACCCSDTYSAKMTKVHNNANVLCFGSLVVGFGLAKELIDAFLENEYEGGRHEVRMDMLKEIEKGNYKKVS